MKNLFKFSTLVTAIGAVAMIGAATASFAADPVKLTILVDVQPHTVKATEQLVADFMAKNPNIKVEVETRPGGTEGDNAIKTRLATGEMPDVFLYNSGSLFHALNAPRNLVDLTDEPFQANVLDSFKLVV